jgi:hypothetical protein
LICGTLIMYFRLPDCRTEAIMQKQLGITAVMTAGKHTVGVYLDNQMQILLCCAAMCRALNERGAR